MIKFVLLKRKYGLGCWVFADQTNAYSDALKILKTEKNALMILDSLKINFYNAALHYMP